MEILIQAVFWTSVAALFYVYAGYPLLVFVISRLFPKQIERAPYEASVTVIVTAYNEERDISEKIENTLSIDYPPEKLEILVASDGSTDRTDETVKGFSDRGVRLFRQEGRMGKTYTQNKAVEQARGEIILFSDATTMYQPDVLSSILPNFADQTVGCVAGKLVYVDASSTAVGTGAKGYWNYETFLKESESRACSLIGASGCLYAVKRSAYVPMYPEACSDFLICTLIYRQGLRSVFEPQAICTEQTNRRTDHEFQMRVRIVSQTFTDLWRNRDMMNPIKSGFYAIELISHKLLRYLVPLFLMLTLIASGILAAASVFFALIFLAQILFYLMALFAWAFDAKKAGLGLAAIPLYFVLANASSAIGIYKFIRGERFASWEPIR